MMIYKTRYQARKHAMGDEVIVKVNGGYQIMGIHEYHQWRKQK